MLNSLTANLKPSRALCHWWVLESGLVNLMIMEEQNEEQYLSKQLKVCCCRVPGEEKGGKGKEISGVCEPVVSGALPSKVKVD